MQADIAMNLGKENQIDYREPSPEWKLKSVSQGPRVYQQWEKELGLFNRLVDLVKRLFSMICIVAKPEGSLHKIKLFESFELPNFFSGKRILIIERKDQLIREDDPSSRNPDAGAETGQISNPVTEDSEDDSFSRNLDAGAETGQISNPVIIDDLEDEFSSLKREAEKIQSISYSMTNIDKNGPPNCFTEQVSDKWIVRNPYQEKYISGKNPKKFDAASAMQANLELARQQQEKEVKRVKSTVDDRRKQFVDFLDKFDINRKEEKCRGKKCRIATDIDEETGKKILNLQKYSYSTSFTVGVRNEMEDDHAAFELDGHPCFVVFDGHLGQDDATYCAENIQRVLENYLSSSKKRLAELNEAERNLFFKKAFILLDQEVKAQERDPQGTTVALNVIIEDSIIICANLADTRTVVINPKREAIQISLDAECDDPKYAKTILKNGGFIKQNRVMGMLAVPRDIGGCGYNDCISPVPTLTEYPVGEFMILACDGLWDVITPLEVGEFLLLMKERGFDLDAMSQALVKLALKRRSEDNITVMVVKTGS